MVCGNRSTYPNCHHDNSAIKQWMEMNKKQFALSKETKHLQTFGTAEPIAPLKQTHIAYTLFSIWTAKKPRVENIMCNQNQIL